MRLYKRISIIILSSLFIAACSPSGERSNDSFDSLNLDTIISAVRRIDGEIDSLSELTISFDEFKAKLSLPAKQVVLQRVKSNTYVGQHPMIYISVIGLDLAEPLRLEDVEDDVSEAARASYVEESARLAKKSLGTITTRDKVVSDLYRDGGIYTVFVEKPYTFEKLYLFDQFAYNREQPLTVTVYRRYDFSEVNGKLTWSNYRVLNTIDPDQANFPKSSVDRQDDDIFRIGRDEVYQID